MYSWVAIAISTILFVQVRADQRAAPNTLTPAEIADGWILLFDGKSPFGWRLDGDAEFRDGCLVFGGKSQGHAETTTVFGPARYQFEAEQSGSWTHPHGETRDAKPFLINWNMPKRFQSIKYKPLGMTPIFNGKDLAGWHAHQAPDCKSKFSVTPEGWLHIENGKGDLQTDKAYKDFILQIECKTNGDRLNSGIFFRCRPNEYQNGYEAQIHNGFGPPKDYTIEKFDPMTHASIAKDKVKYEAIDYGTGAIYRRIPARLQAAKDKEWFTMTIVAQGRHIGVWVNGIMVTDWTDNRPANDNARNGYKEGAGHISLQGHDPTTNLDFRNIRIAELPSP
jgi:Domain of Unknown Function (DUF1080)